MELEGVGKASRGLADAFILDRQSPCLTASLLCLGSRRVFLDLQRARGPTLATVFEIAGPEPTGSPLAGSSPTSLPFNGHNDFNAAAYLQRKSAMKVESGPQLSWPDALLDHRIQQSQGLDLEELDSEPQFRDDHPLLEEGLRSGI